MNNQGLMNLLTQMEKAIIGNNYIKKLISFRNVVDAEKQEKKRIAEQIRKTMDNMHDEYNMEHFEQDSKYLELF